MGSKNSALDTFVDVERKDFQHDDSLVRGVFISDIERHSQSAKLDKYLADRLPLYYREAHHVSETLEDGYFMSAFKETLDRLPTSESFRESHLGEITSAIFAEEIIGYKLIYNKLSILTAENANPYKMDLVMYKPGSDPVEFILGEVKSSMKGEDDLPARHDKSCYASVFNSMNEYDTSDRDFDLSAARDRLGNMPEKEKESIRKALLPYSDRIVNYAGFVVVDSCTARSDEIAVLGTRENEKDFDVDLICVEELSDIADSVYAWLEDAKNVWS